MLYITHNIATILHLRVMYSTFQSQVWSATDKCTNETVALKRVRMDNEKEGVSIYMLFSVGVVFKEP